MKKLTLCCLVLGCLGAPASAADLASVVPEDAFLYAEIADPMGIWADFEQSGLLTIIQHAPGGEMGLRAACAMIQQKIQTDFGVRWTDFVTRCASRVGIVMIRDPKGAPQPCFLLDASETEADLRRLIRGLEATVTARNNRAVFLNEAYGGAKLRVGDWGQGRFAAAFLGDVLAVGSVDEVKALVDGRARRPLAIDPAFAKIRKRLALPRGVHVFLNTKRAIEQLGDGPDVKPLMDLGLADLRWIIYTSGFEGRGIRDRILLHTGERKVGVMNLVAWLTPGSTQAAKVLPKTCPMLLSLTFGSGTELWGRLVEFLAEGGEVEKLAKLDQGKEHVKLQFGVDLEEGFVGTLGGEIFIAGNPDYRKGGATGSWLDMMPIYGVRVARKEALQTTIHQVMAAQAMFGQGVQRQVAEHRGVEVNTLVAPGAADGWAYAFVGDYLIVARNGALVKQCVDANISGETLATDGRYQAVHRCMPKDVLLTAYSDIEGIALAALAEGPKEAGEPLRGIMSQLRAFYGAVRVEPDGVLIESYTRPGILGLMGLGFTGYQSAAAVEPLPPVREEPMRAPEARP
jgi:hypothetical protein